jgi:hypothetical protein
MLTSFHLRKWSLNESALKVKSFGEHLAANIISRRVRYFAKLWLRLFQKEGFWGPDIIRISFLLWSFYPEGSGLKLRYQN